MSVVFLSGGVQDQKIQPGRVVIRIVVYIDRMVNRVLFFSPRRKVPAPIPETPEDVAFAADISLTSFESIFALPFVVVGRPSSDTFFVSSLSQSARSPPIEPAPRSTPRLCSFDGTNRRRRVRTNQLPWLIFSIFLLVLSSLLFRVRRSVVPLLPFSSAPPSRDGLVSPPHLLPFVAIVLLEKTTKASSQLVVSPRVIIHAVNHAFPRRRCHVSGIEQRVVLRRRRRRVLVAPRVVVPSVSRR